MTDVEAKTPTKRSLGKDGKKGSAKKAKFSPNPQQNKAPNKLNNTQNSNQKAKQNKKSNQSENVSAKKIKPFVGTSQISTPEQGKKGNKAVKNTNEKGEKKKPRKNIFLTLKEKINSEEKGPILEDVERKIKAIQARTEITKSAKKKLRLLFKLKNIAEGKSPVQQKSKDGNMSTAQSRRDRKKKALNAAKLNNNAGKKENVIAQATSEVKANATNKNVKVQNKQMAKKIKMQTKKVEDDESDEDSGEESDEDEEESGAEQEEAEGEEVDSDEDDDEDEEESEEDGEEVEGESDEGSEEESDEDDSEEDSPPQVSNKKQKKK